MSKELVNIYGEKEEKLFSEIFSELNGQNILYPKSFNYFIDWSYSNKEFNIFKFERWLKEKELLKENMSIKDCVVDNFGVSAFDFINYMIKDVVNDCNKIEILLHECWEIVCYIYDNYDKELGLNYDKRLKEINKKRDKLVKIKERDKLINEINDLSIKANEFYSEIVRFKFTYSGRLDKKLEKIYSRILTYGNSHDNRLRYITLLEKYYKAKMETELLTSEQEEMELAEKVQEFDELTYKLI